MPRDQFVTALEPQKHTSSLQLTLGENTHDFAFGDFFSSGADRRIRMADVDRDAAERTQNRMQNRFVVILLVDYVTNRTRADELQHERVHPTDVIGYKEKTALRQVLQADRSDPIKATYQQSTKKREGAFGAGSRRHHL